MGRMLGIAFIFQIFDTYSLCFAGAEMRSLSMPRLLVSASGGHNHDLGQGNQITNSTTCCMRFHFSILH